ncbi:hypothetical protein B0H13DRAFT_2302473 [Mycena leptocephala]|nr:hypothetical protein B0H13DRAFT_2302473 [Mycena leptocephala]
MANSQASLQNLEMYFLGYVLPILRKIWIIGVIQNLDRVYFRRLHISPFSNVTPPLLLSLPLQGNQPALVTPPRS